MRGKLEEISGAYQGDIFRSTDGNFVIGRVIEQQNGQSAMFVDAEDETVVKGRVEPDDDLMYGTQYRFYGKWVHDVKHGRQFQFETFIQAVPHGEAGIKRFLQEAPNIGRSLANALWEKFGSDAVKILREKPAVAAAGIKKLSPEHADEAADFLKKNASLSACMIDVMNLFDGYRIPQRITKLVIRRFGNKAVEKIRRNPFLLWNYAGVGFGKCDAMYLGLGHDPSRLRRQSLCIFRTMDECRNGDTWFPRQLIENGLRGRISGTALRLIPAVKLAKRMKWIAIKRDRNGLIWLSKHKTADSEAYIAERVADLMTADHEPWVDVNHPIFEKLEESQREELVKAVAGGRIGILGGGPGTGKSFVLGLLIRLLMEMHGKHTVAAAAPTGKAAVRLTEVMRDNGVSIQATTIHSLLGVASSDNGGWSFIHNEDMPLPYRFVVIDEKSMQDADLFASMIAAIGPDTCLLLVGDINQLPPVGHGAPARDLIRAKVNYGELTKPRRNSGDIVAACHAIRTGKPIQFSKRINPETGENLLLVSATSPEIQLVKLQNLIEVAAKKGYDPIWDVQVIVPLNAKSKVSRKEINSLLQNVLNPSGVTAGNNPFRPGDKVICLKNGFYPVDESGQAAAAAADAGPDDEPNYAAWDNAETDDMVRNEDGKVFVANGEQGVVMSIAEKYTIVGLLKPKRVIRVPRGNGDGDEEKETEESEESNASGCNWDLAYAISCHKSQGSQYPITIVILDEFPSARQVCCREWVTTALSRAQEMCFCVGLQATIDAFCRRQALPNRKTFLVELIEDRLALLEKHNAEAGMALAQE